MAATDEPLEVVSVKLSALVSEHGLVLRSQLTRMDDLRFEAADETGKFGAEMLISSGGALQVVLDCVYDFLFPERP